tara:strand:- start:245 stop:583 length:339 start_codon:yes stop_codon:yes gene_type:complete
MIWPPLKAWTSTRFINGNNHFVAINYGGKNSDRWVVLMSVLDSNLILKVSWLKLIDPSKWKCGWDEKVSSIHPGKVEYKNKIAIINFSYASNDSGLTIPITKNNIRPWFGEI